MSALLMLIIGTSGGAGYDLYIIPPRPVYVWSIPRTYTNRPRYVAPDQREKRLAYQRTPLTPAYRHDQLKCAIRQLYLKEQNRHLKESLLKMLDILNDYEELRESVKEYRRLREEVRFFHTRSSLSE